MGSLSREQITDKIKRLKKNLLEHQRGECTCSGKNSMVKDVSCARNQIDLTSDIGKLIRQLGKM